jgi:hypothetical protein
MNSPLDPTRHIWLDPWLAPLKCCSNLSAKKSSRQFGRQSLRLRSVVRPVLSAIRGKALFPHRIRCLLNCVHRTIKVQIPEVPRALCATRDVQELYTIPRAWTHQQVVIAVNIRLLSCVAKGMQSFWQSERDVTPPSSHVVIRPSRKLQRLHGFASETLLPTSGWN